MTPSAPARPELSPARQVALALSLSVAWGACFVVALQQTSLYPLLSACAVVCGAVALWATPTLRQPPPRAVLVRGVLIGALLGALSVLGTHAGYWLSAPFFPSMVADIVRLSGVAQVTTLRLLLVVVVAVAEELVWRGLLLRGLSRLAQENGARGVVVEGALIGTSALVYALAQAGPGSIWLVVIAVVLGVLWGALSRATGTLWAGLVAHLIWTPVILGFWTLLPP